MSKEQLRKDAKKRLSSIIKSDKEILEGSLSRILFEYLTKFQSDFSTSKIHLNKKPMVGVYDPIQQEPVWYVELIKIGSELNHFDFAFPHIMESNEMSFYSKKNWDLTNLNIGISLENLSDASEVRPDILIIPGLAFTKSGKRLGRGKGFYDRYLENFEGHTIGICFECQLFDDLPTDEHDQTMDVVITESNIY